MKSSEKEILRFIDRLYKDLYLSDEVLHHSNHNKTDKFNNLKEYFDMLEKMHDRVLKSKSRKEILKKLYQDKYVIRKKDIPDSYYELFLKMDLDRGFGHVTKDDIDIDTLSEMVIDDQLASLNTWLDYLLSEEAQKYPFWAKYWAFQGMLRLGKYNKKEGKYNKRTIDTTTSFVEFDKKALESSIEAITKYLNKEEISDKELAKLIESGSFSKSYLYFLNQSKNLNLEEKNQGVWVKYKMGSDHHILSNSLKGYNTGWCTVNAGSSENQLKYGDFYVYYTLDGNNEYKIPRIAIRMDGNNNSIAEIRGIESEQKLEPEMVEIAKEKARELFDKENYFELEKNTNKLTEIYYKQKNKEKLTKEEVTFLYDTDLFKVGFADWKDPRIEELKKRRNKKKDLALIYDCTIEEVALTKEELNNNTKVFVGDWDSDEYGIILPEVIIGDVNLNSLKTTDGLKMPRVVKGDLLINYIKSADNIVFPEIVAGDLGMYKTVSIKGSILPKFVGGYIGVSSLESLDGVKLPDNMNSILLCNLKSGKDLLFPERMNGTIDIRSDIDISEVKFPRIIVDSLCLRSTKEIDNVKFPEVVFGDMTMDHLVSAKNTIFPKRVGGELVLDELISAQNIVFPNEVLDNLLLDNLEKVDNVKLPEYVGGELNLSSLKDPNGLVLPKYVGKNLLLDNLRYGNNITLPETVGGDLYLRRLVDGTGLILPSFIDGDILLSDTFDITTLSLPDDMAGYIYIGKTSYSLEELKEQNNTKK